jgi:nucleoid-associated protein YgaU
MRLRVISLSLALLLAGSVAVSGCSLAGGTPSADEGTPTAVTVPTLSAPSTSRAGTPGSGAARTPGAAATRTSGASATSGSAAPTSAPASDGDGGATTGGGGEGKIYVVEEGDTLAVIADKVYGDGSKWQQIYEANKDVIGDSPDSLSIGMKLEIPAE